MEIKKWLILQVTLTLAVICLLLTSTNVWAQNTPTVLAEDNLKTSKMLPALSLNNLKGEAVPLQHYLQDGKVIVLKFWSAWTAAHCKPCELDLQQTSALQKKWQQEDAIELITISTDKGGQAKQMVQDFLTEKGWQFEVLFDEADELQKQLDVQTVPSILIADETGQILFESYHSRKNYQEALSSIFTK